MKIDIPLSADRKLIVRLDGPRSFKYKKTSQGLEAVDKKVTVKSQQKDVKVILGLEDNGIHFERLSNGTIIEGQTSAGILVGVFDNSNQLVDIGTYYVSGGETTTKIEGNVIQKRFTLGL